MVRMADSIWWGRPPSLYYPLDSIDAIQGISYWIKKSEHYDFTTIMIQKYVYIIFKNNISQEIST